MDRNSSKSPPRVDPSMVNQMPQQNQIPHQNHNSAPSCCGIYLRMLLTLLWILIFCVSISAISVTHMIFPSSIFLRSGTAVYHSFNVILHIYLIVSSIVGCIFNCTSNPTNLKWMLFSTLSILIVMVIHVGFGVWNIVNNQLENRINDALLDNIRQYGNDTTSTITLDTIHELYSCCGANGSIDFGGKKPESCIFFDSGCTWKIGFIEYMSRILGFTVLFFLILLLVIYILAHLCCPI